MPPPSGAFQAAAAPAAACGLELRDADVELADGRRRSEQMTVRRVELREHFELREPRGDVRLERRAQSLRVEQIERLRQAVTGARRGFDGEPPVGELARPASRSRRA